MSLQRLPIELLHIIGRHLSAEDADALCQTSAHLEWRLRPLYQFYLKRDYGLNLPMLKTGQYDAKLYYNVIDVRDCLEIIGAEPPPPHTLYRWFVSHSYLDVHFDFQGRFNDTYTFRIIPGSHSIHTVLQQVKNMHGERLELLDFHHLPHTLRDLQRCRIQVGSGKPQLKKVNLLRFHDLRIAYRDDNDIMATSAEEDNEEVEDEDLLYDDFVRSPTPPRRCRFEEEQ